MKAASAAVELIKRVTHEDQQSEQVFQLLEDFLCCVDEAAAEQGMPACLLVNFRWRLLSLLGLEPQLVDCIHCGNRLERMSSYCFRPSDGGIVCLSCSGELKGNAGGPLMISYAALRHIYRSGRIFPLPREELTALSEQDFDRERQAADRYQAYHLGEQNVKRS